MTTTSPLKRGRRRGAKRRASTPFDAHATMDVFTAQGRETRPVLAVLDEIAGHYPVMHTLLLKQAQFLLDTLPASALTLLRLGVADEARATRLAQMVAWTGYVLGAERRLQQPLDRALATSLGLARTARERDVPTWLTLYLLSSLSAEAPKTPTSPPVRRNTQGALVRLPEVNVATLSATPWYLFSATPVDSSPDPSYDRPAGAGMELRLLSREPLEMVTAIMRAAKYNAALGYSPLRAPAMSALLDEGHVDLSWMEVAAGAADTSPSAQVMEATQPDATSARQLRWPWIAPRYAWAPVYALPVRVPVCAIDGCDTRLWQMRVQRSTMRKTDRVDAAGNAIFEEVLSDSPETRRPVGVCVQATAQLVSPTGTRRWLTPPVKDAPKRDAVTPSQAAGALHVCAACGRIVCSEHITRLDTPRHAYLSGWRQAVTRGERLAWTARGGYGYTLFTRAAQAVDSHSRRVERAAVAVASGASNMGADAVDAAGIPGFRAPICIKCALSIDAHALSFAEAGVLALEHESAQLAASHEASHEASQEAANPD